MIMFCKLTIYFCELKKPFPISLLLDRDTTSDILVRPAKCKICEPCMTKIDYGKCQNYVDKTRKKKCINRECKVVGEYMLKKSKQRGRKRRAKMSAEEITRLNKKKRTDYADITHIKKKTIHVRKSEDNNQK